MYYFLWLKKKKKKVSLPKVEILLSIVHPFSHITVLIMFNFNTFSITLITSGFPALILFSAVIGVGEKMMN